MMEIVGLVVLVLSAVWELWEKHKGLIVYIASVVLLVWQLRDMHKALEAAKERIEQLENEQASPEEREQVRHELENLKREREIATRERHELFLASEHPVANARRARHSVIGQVYGFELPLVTVGWKRAYDAPGGYVGFVELDTSRCLASAPIRDRFEATLSASSAYGMSDGKDVFPLWAAVVDRNLYVRYEAGPTAFVDPEVRIDGQAEFLNIVGAEFECIGPLGIETITATCARGRDPCDLIKALRAHFGRDIVAERFAPEEEQAKAVRAISDAQRSDQLLDSAPQLRSPDFR
jgi:hypothetical protein